ncbi:hypothetical protein [Brevibacillus borstelensis]|uniref:hypothetical protein n=1 Tax=Brevibacillus borstelensis TaxID=45462 RepID=UPI0030BF502F
MKRRMLIVVLGTICLASIWVMTTFYRSQMMKEAAKAVTAGEKYAFEQAFQRVLIGQQDDQSSSQVAEFERDRMPRQPIQLGLHKREAFIHIDLTTNQSLEAAERFLSQVELFGDVKYSTSVREVSRGNYQLTMTFSDIKDQLAFRFGNIPTITLRRMEPLTLAVLPGKSEGAVLMLPESRESRSLYITEGLGDILLQFSEPMIRKEEAGRSVDGYPAVWLDERTISLDVRKVNRTALDLTQFHSQRGNYLPQEYRYVALYKKRPLSWLSYPESKVVGFSSFDSFYEQLIPSPDRESYLGIIDRGSSKSRRGGRQVALVLEQKGRSPLLIEPMLEGTALSRHSTIDWLDAGRFLYVEEKLGTVYNLASGEKTPLFDESSTGSIALEMAVDNVQGSIYVIFVRSAGDKNLYRLEKRTYRLHDLKLEKTESLGETLLHPREQLPAFPIKVRNDGVYYTVPGGQENRTVFVSRKGKSWATEGEIVWATDSGEAVLKRQKSQNAKKYMFWKIGGRQREVSLARGEVLAFGPYLVAGDGLRYQVWDERRKRWEPLELAEGDIRVPAAQRTPLYARER